MDAAVSCGHGACPARVNSVSYVIIHTSDRLDCAANAKINLTCICDPLWEKVQFRANNEFELCTNIAAQVKLHVYPLFGMKGNYDPLPCSYHWTDSDPTILEPAVPCQNCTVDISAISARSVTEQIRGVRVQTLHGARPLHIVATS